MSASEAKPIFCTLSPAAMAQRVAQIRTLTRRHLRSHQLEGSVLRLTNDLAAAVELAEIVAMERECCAFLDFKVSSHADAVELRIEGPEQDGTETHWLFTQFLPELQASAPAAACACCKG